MSNRLDLFGLFGLFTISDTAILLKLIALNDLYYLYPVLKRFEILILPAICLLARYPFSAISSTTVLTRGSPTLVAILRVIFRINLAWTLGLFLPPWSRLIGDWCFLYSPTSLE